MANTAEGLGDGVESESYRKLSFAIIGCAQKVHRVLGPGVPEAVYHRALCYELADAAMVFESEKIVEVPYNGKVCGEFRMDVVVAQRIILELKALDTLTDLHVSQAISYLKATGLHLVLLLNFGAKSLEVRRVVL